MKPIYLDYAASTPVDPRVKAAMEPYFSKVFGNAGSLHSFGQEASAAIFKSRDTIAKAIGVSYRDIIFTGSATEANNLAIRGVLKGVRVQDLGSSEIKTKSIPHSRIIVSAIEHESILETCRDLEKDGIEVIYIPVSQEGIVDLKKLKAALNERTILVSIMHANNEIGTIQPISEIARIVRDARNDRGDRNAKRSDRSTRSPILDLSYPLFHTDAVQSFQYLDCDAQSLGVDFMTLSAHKIYGPKGIGVLYAKFFNGRYSISPIITGGDQQGGIRPGTENTPNIVGFAKAVELAVAMREKEGKRVQQLRDYFWKGIKKIYPAAKLNSPIQSLRGAIATKQSYINVRLPRSDQGVGARNDNVTMLPNILNVYFPSNTAQDLLIKLDLAGIAVSPGAACMSHTAQSSYVLEALGWPLKRSSGSLRFSFGRQTTKQELDKTLTFLAKSAIM